MVYLGILALLSLLILIHELGHLAAAKAAGWARLALEIADCLGAPAIDQAEEVEARLKQLKARIAGVLDRPGETQPRLGLQ